MNGIDEDIGGLGSSVHGVTMAGHRVERQLIDGGHRDSGEVAEELPPAAVVEQAGARIVAQQLATDAGVDSMDEPAVRGEEQHATAEGVIHGKVTVAVEIVEEIEQIVRRAEQQRVGVEDVVDDVVDGYGEIVVDGRRLLADGELDDLVGVVARVVDARGVERIEVEVEAAPEVEFLPGRRAAADGRFEEVPHSGHLRPVLRVVDPPL